VIFSTSLYCTQPIFFSFSVCEVNFQLSNIERLFDGATSPSSPGFIVGAQSSEAFWFTFPSFPLPFSDFNVCTGSRFFFPRSILLSVPCLCPFSFFSLCLLEAFRREAPDRHADARFFNCFELEFHCFPSFGRLFFPSILYSRIAFLFFPYVFCSLSRILSLRLHPSFSRPPTRTKLSPFSW